MFLKKILLPLMLLMTLLPGCSKSDDCKLNMGTPGTDEINNLQAYLTSKGITADRDSRGFFYRIIAPGSGSDAPTVNSTVTVSYEGSLTDGSVFDRTPTGQTVAFPLNGLIQGWQYGIPLVRRGGVIDLYLPPSLGYGCRAVGSIPGNSILIFRITLLNY